jgi:hypothetical protein
MCSYVPGQHLDDRSARTLQGHVIHMVIALTPCPTTVLRMYLCVIHLMHAIDELTIVFSTYP